MNQRLYNKLFPSVNLSKQNETVANNSDLTLLSANASQMKIIATIGTDIRILGLQIPVTFRVVPDFVYDLIVVEQFLRDTEVIINVGTNTLTLYRGLLTLPMVRANNLMVVKTTANITIPPLSQALFQVTPASSLKPGNYIIEGNLQPPTDKIWIGRTVVNPEKAKMYCCALNVTEKPLKFRAGTPMGILSSVRVCKPFKPEPPPDQGKLPPIAEMKTALEQKGIIFQGTIMTGSDLNQMITLLYRNVDLYATCMKDFVGPDLIEYNMEIDPNQQPIRQKQFRFAKSERDEIEKQVQELRDAQIIKAIKFTMANVHFFVKKKDLFGSQPAKRLVFDMRRLKLIYKEYSYRIDSINQTLDYLSDYQPKVWCQIDLKCAFQQTRVPEQTTDYATFESPSGVWGLTRLVTGDKSASSVFQRLLEIIMTGLRPANLLIYIDDLAVIA
jgi:hypothetical protein